MFTVPTKLGVEKKTNPFLRPFDKNIRNKLNMLGSTDIEVFSKIRTLKDSGWGEEDIGNASDDESKEKKKPRARIFMIGGESTTFKIESWMDKIKKKYDMME